MKQKSKKMRALALLLAAVMMVGLTGCKENETESQTPGQTPQTSGGENSGRWVQEEVTPAQTVYSFEQPVVLEDGSLQLISKNADDTISLWSSADNGASWQETTTQWKEETGASYFGVTRSLPDGGSLVTAIQDDGASRSWSCWVKDSGASGLRQISLPESIVEIADLRPVNSQTAILLGMTLTPATPDAPSVLVNEDGMMSVISAWELDLATGSCTEWPDFAQTLGGSMISGLARDVSGDENAFYYLSYQESGTNLMHRSLDGTVTTAFENLPDASVAAFAASADREGNYYYASQSGIYRIAKGGSLAELVVKSAGTVLENTSITPMGLTVCGDGSFLIQTMENKEDEDGTYRSHLYRIYWDSSAPAEQTSLALTVWSLETNDTVHAAIMEYQAQNPGQKVEYQVAMEGGTSREDAISALNAALLAGSGPDVLILDDMDWEAYQEQGLLAELSGIIPLDTLKENIAASFQNEEGKVYVMPARFAVPVASASQEDLSALESLDSLAQALQQLPARPAYDCQSDQYYEPLEQPYGMGFISVEQLLDFTLESSASALVQDGVNSQAVGEILSFVQQVGSYYGMEEYQNFVTNAVVAGDMSGEEISYGDGGYECFFTHNAKMAWDTMLTPAYITAVLQDDSSFSVVCCPGLAQGAFQPRTMAAISAAATHTQEAENFLKILFGDEVQSTWQQDGMPVQSAALEKSIEQNCSGEALDQARALLDSLKTPVTLPDDTVYNALLENARELISGKTTLDQAQAGVENALKLYLAEQE